MSDGVTICNRSAALGLAALLVMAFTSGCGSKKTVVTPETARPQVVHPDVKITDLNVVPGEGSFTVRWKQQGTGIISGYNIYVAFAPVGSVEEQKYMPPIAPHNSVVYPGDTNPDDEYIEYVVENTLNGIRYNVTVGIVFPDQTVSELLPAVPAVSGPRGECKLAVRYKSENDGFSFITKKSIRADDSANDIYFYTKDGVDYLASPSRLNNYLRESSFNLIKTRGSLEEIRQILSDKQSITQGADRIAISTGNWVLMKTREGFSVLIQILELSGKDETREAQLKYAVCPFRHLMVF